MYRETRAGNFKGRWVALYLTLTLAASAGALLLNPSHAGGVAPAPSATPMTPFVGGPFEASGVAYVPGTDGVLFVDDGRDDEVLWMRLTGAGGQAGQVVPIKLGVTVVDKEGMTFDGEHFYVVGSLSKYKMADGPGIARFRFDAQAQRVVGTEAVSDFKRFLARNVSELRGMETTKYRDGGINLEGVAWDPVNGRLLLGVRSPVVDGQALVIPLKLRDPRGALSYDNLEVGEAMRLPLGGLGVRGIEYDARAGTYRVIAGAPEDQRKTDFGLWEWDGAEGRSGLRETRKFGRELKPEGVTRASAGGRDFLLVVFDASGYSTTD